MEEKGSISQYHENITKKFIAREKGGEEYPGEDFNGITELEYYKRVHPILEEYYENHSSPEGDLPLVPGVSDSQSTKSERERERPKGRRGAT